MTANGLLYVLKNDISPQGCRADHGSLDSMVNGRCEGGVPVSLRGFLITEKAGYDAGT